MKYITGEEIKPGDKVLYFNNEASIDFVACAPDDNETAWYFEEFGGGVMISDPKVAGAVFVPANMLGDATELKFVSRAGEGDEA